MPAADRFFVDTNVLLYAVDAADPLKRAAAGRWLDYLWRHGNGSLSWQVLHEYYANAVRKLKVPTPAVRATVEAFSEWKPMGGSLGLVQRAWQWTDAAQVPFWDAMILAAAERAGCTWILSEDFQANRRFGEITVVNPFLIDPDRFGPNPARQRSQ